MTNAGVANIRKLQSEQEKALLECQGKLSQWKKFHNDYIVLQKRLETLPDKLSHDVMVPFGSVAFMPGQLVHTNEIMVLLGDNWFVDRSAKQACSIVGRRVEKCEETIRSLELEIQQFENWKKYTSTVKEEAKQFVEIVEDYDEESEKTWRESHKVRLRQHREKRKSCPSTEGGDHASTLVGASVSDISDDEFWRRLEELEMEEFEAKQLERSTAMSREHMETQGDLPSISGNGGPIRRSDSDAEKRVVWKDDLWSVKETPQPSVVLQLNFSDVDTTSGSSPVFDPKVKTGSSGCTIQSPADIYALFGAGQESQSQPKSILKKSTATRVVQQSQPNPCVHSIDLPLSGNIADSVTISEDSPEIEAVSAVVAERKSDQLEAPCVVTASRKVSKFKSQRQAKNS